MKETKNWLINAICERHPSYGVARGMSEYVGGMRDTGKWDRWKMFNSYSKKELREFLDEIIASENIPKIPLTEEELAKQKILINLGNGTWTTQLNKEYLEAMHKELENKLFYGV